MSYKSNENVSRCLSPLLTRSVNVSRSSSPSLSMVYQAKEIKNEIDMDINSSENDVAEYIVNNYPPSTSPISETFTDPVSMVTISETFTDPVSMVTLSKSSYYSAEKRQPINFDNPKEGSLDDDLELKKIRRRMKNKISAQESRRRKKEYVDMLEHRLKQKDSEKDLLQQKVTELEEKISYQTIQDQHSSKEYKKSPILLPPPLKKTLSPYETNKENDTFHKSRVRHRFDIIGENYTVNDTSFKRETSSMLSNHSHSVKRRNIDSILENKFSRHFSPNPENSCMLIKEQLDDCSSATCSLFLQLSNTDHITSPSHT
ncbi:cyclic AMP-responsive element-binding protein 3-like protein 4 isoform X2 [Hydra vulgaris]|uniref:cyclic AMP-responsive element-binding protein 3-like protein 4 isoform X2 n=1 Tax=Hydra vulgaris TaxID=6087 RepID=UPI001F5F6EAE|nr:cyclic AMP-responsive element-binding protein 3-like protein 4 isoform X2 [Hydra vulgaris]